MAKYYLAPSLNCCDKRNETKGRRYTIFESCMNNDRSAQSNRYWLIMATTSGGHNLTRFPAPAVHVAGWWLLVASCWWFKLLAAHVASCCWPWPNANHELGLLCHHFTLVLAFTFRCPKDSHMTSLLPQLRFVMGRRYSPQPPLYFGL